MSGCFLFFQRLSGGRRRTTAASPRMSQASSLECGLSCSMQPLASAALSSTSCVTHGGLMAGPDYVVCSPASSSGASDCGYSSCTDSDGASCYYRRASSASLAGSYGSATSYGSAASSGACTGGAPSPTSHVPRLGGAGGEAAHARALQVACEVVLMEHQLKGGADAPEGVCLFVHKRLRPIRTRPEGE